MTLDKEEAEAVVSVFTVSCWFRHVIHTGAGVMWCPAAQQTGDRLGTERVSPAYLQLDWPGIDWSWYWWIDGVTSELTMDTLYLHKYTSAKRWGENNEGYMEGKKRVAIIVRNESTLGLGSLGGER